MTPLQRAERVRKINDIIQRIANQVFIYEKNYNNLKKEINAFKTNNSTSKSAVTYRNRIKKKLNNYESIIKNHINAVKILGRSRMQEIFSDFQLKKMEKNRSITKLVEYIKTYNNSK
uniref:Uncharacterized protein n=1 Tax=viral metagenome TaxID=1070528 RepID=A0A6C0JT76_9ZZZZ